MHDFVSYLFYLLQRGMRFAVPAALICGLILAVCYAVCRKKGRRTECRAAALSYYMECSLVQIIPQQLCAAGVAQLAQRLCFDLTHPLPGHVELLAQFF